MPVHVKVAGNSLSVGFDADWLAANPLTIADLEREQGFLQELGYTLDIL